MRRGLVREAAEAKAEAERACAQEDEARAAVRALSNSFHPVDLTTGELKTTEDLAEQLAGGFETLWRVGEEARVGQKRLKGLAKAERVTSKLLTFFDSFMGFLNFCFSSLRIDEGAQEAGKLLFSGFYLELAAQRASKAERRASLRALAGRLHLRARELLSGMVLSEAQREGLERTAKECARLFQRSSSATEGRNGRLPLWRHSQRRLENGKLAALTVIHNFWIERSDGKTAAERLFEAKPRDLFAHLLEEMPLPSRPAASRARDPNTLRVAG